MKKVILQTIKAVGVLGLFALCARTGWAIEGEMAHIPAFDAKVLPLAERTSVPGANLSLVDPLATVAIPGETGVPALVQTVLPGSAQISLTEHGAGLPSETATRPGPEAALTVVQNAVDHLPDLGKADAGQSREAGQNLSDSLTGERSAVAAGAVLAVEAPAPTAEAPIKEQIAWAKPIFDAARAEMHKDIIGHEKEIDHLLIAAAAGENVLLEGLPGDGKTETAKTMARVVGGKFSRIQFTADLLPSDIVGVMIFDQKLQDFRFRPGPIHANVVLADEFNRAPPKTHSAMLEAMGERHVTVDGKQMDLDRLNVLATQNPKEQDGTYKSPEAELDRFMFKLIFGQPNENDLIQIMRRRRLKDAPAQAKQITTLDQLDEIRRIAERINMSEDIERYIARIVMAPSAHENIKDSVKYSVYTRAAQALERAARLRAVMDGRDYVRPSDVQEMAYPVMRHRFELDHNAEVKNTDEIIKKIVELPGLLPKTAVPAPVKK